MGSWNGTCALTHLPIRSGDKVRGFILTPSNIYSLNYPAAYKSRIKEMLKEAKPYTEEVEKEFEQASEMVLKDRFPELGGGGFSYSTGLYYPISYGFRGVYNNYGSMEKIKKDANTKAILAFFNEGLKKEASDYDKFYIKDQVYGEEEDKKPTKIPTMEKLVTYIERGRTVYGFCMVLESAFQTAVQAYEDGGKDVNFRFISRDTFLKDGQLMIDFIKNFKSKKKKGEILSLSHEVEFHCRSSGSDKEERNSAGDFFFRMGDRMIDTIFSQFHLLEHLSEAGVLENCCDHFHFHKVFEECRRAWMPQAGAGSQDESYVFHRKIADCVIKHIQEKKRERMEEIDIDNPKEVSWAEQYY